MTEIFKNKSEYFNKIQNPATRLADPQSLVDGALAALQQFPEPEIKASAMCVLLYRYLESDGKIHIGNEIEVLDSAQFIRNALDNVDRFENVRWYLSLGLVISAVQLKMHHQNSSGSNPASKILIENIDKLHLSVRHGQPLTNVVKSVAALIGIYKYSEISALDEIVIKNIIQLFSSIKADYFANYKYENQWVFEELGMVYSTLYEIAKLHSLRIASPELSIKEVMQNFADSKIPMPHRKILVANSK